MATPEQSTSPIVQKKQGSLDYCLDTMKRGPNKNRKTVCEAKALVKAENGTSWYSVVDKNDVEFILLIYGVQFNAIPRGARLILNHPYLHETTVQVAEGSGPHK